MSRPVESSTPDWQPTLRGEGLMLRPVRADDLDALHVVGGDPLVWAQHSERNRHERPVFEKYFAGALASGGGLVAVESERARLIGSSRYYDWNPAERSVVIGYTFLARDHWGKGTNRLMKRLMLDHAFRWADVVWFHASPGNTRSRRALERIGARLDREELVPVGGVPSPRCIYRIDRAAWACR
jgi:RimJ/RimL family protein N-acetyltransferase